MSAFEVNGEQIQKGLKGFIYGERGVWRPGDSIYVAFVLEDKNNVLPSDHPVTFELLDPKGQLVQRNVRKNGIESLALWYIIVIHWIIAFCSIVRKMG